MGLCDIRRVDLINDDGFENAQTNVATILQPR